VLALTAIAIAAPAVAPMTEIPVYQRLTESDLTLVDVPDALEHEGLVRSLDEAVGAIALEPLLPGEPLRAERLGTDARATLLGPDDDLVLLRMGRAEQWAPGRVDLVAVADGGACLVAQDVRAHGSPEPGILSLAMPVVQAHRLRWAVTQQMVLPLSRNPIDRSRRPDLACSGGLPVSDIRLATGAGSLLRVGQPVAEFVVSHPDRVAAESVTVTDLWVHGLQRGHTAATVALVGSPPVVLDITIVDDPPTPGLREAVGGLIVGDAIGVADARAWPPEAADVQIHNGKALVRPRQPGPVQVFTRTLDGQLDLQDLFVTEGWAAPARGEVVLPLRLGKRRKLSMPAAVVAAWTGDPKVASVELKGRRARVTGEGGGTTRVIVMDETGATSSVRVVLPNAPRPVQD